MRMQPCPPRSDLDALLKRANAVFDALTPEQQREHRAAQRKSWVIGEMMLSDLNLTREQASQRYDEMLDRL